MASRASCARAGLSGTSEVVEFLLLTPGADGLWPGAQAGPGRGGVRGAAPEKIERPDADRVKTDQRDAERVLPLLMIDGLDPVRVPRNKEEALRDVFRARERHPKPQIAGAASD